MASQQTPSVLEALYEPVLPDHDWMSIPARRLLRLLQDKGTKASLETALMKSLAGDNVKNEKSMLLLKGLGIDDVLLKAMQESMVENGCALDAFIECMTEWRAECRECFQSLAHVEVKQEVKDEILEAATEGVEEALEAMSVSSSGRRFTSILKSGACFDIRFDTDDLVLAVD